jgi:hypothetical protein
MTIDRDVDRTWWADDFDDDEHSHVQELELSARDGTLHQVAYLMKARPELKRTTYTVALKVKGAEQPGVVDAATGVLFYGETSSFAGEPTEHNLKRRLKKTLERGWAELDNEDREAASNLQPWTSDVEGLL